MQAPATVLITGAARRIGRALALAFAQKGWRIGLHYRRSREAADQLAAEIRASGGAAAALQADLADAADVERLVPWCAAALGAPTCLVNNASMLVDDDIESLDPKVWDAQLAVNVKAPVLLSRAFAAAQPAGATGNVINVVDPRAWKPGPGFFSYAASEMALWDITRRLARALAPRVRVNAIAPGPALGNAHQIDDELARVILFILDAPAMTGQLIALGGVRPGGADGDIATRAPQIS